MGLRNNLKVVTGARAFGSPQLLQLSGVGRPDLRKACVYSRDDLDLRGGSSSWPFNLGTGSLGPSIFCILVPLRIVALATGRHTPMWFARIIGIAFRQHIGVLGIIRPKKT